MKEGKHSTSVPRHASRQVDVGRQSAACHCLGWSKDFGRVPVKNHSVVARISMGKVIAQAESDDGGGGSYLC